MPLQNKSFQRHEIGDFVFLAREIYRGLGGQVKHAGKTLLVEVYTD